MEKIDFKKFDPKFENRPIKIAEPQSAIDVARDEFIKANALTYKLEPVVPENIQGLVKLNGRRLPATRNWWTRVTSFERNGFFNLHTHRLNTKLTYYGFFVFLLWGLTNHVFTGVWIEETRNNDERPHQPYDKLAIRKLPFNRVWSRPG